MKILHISPTYFPAIGGAERHIKALSEGLASRGHEVTVLTANARRIWDLSPPRSGALPEVEVINAVTVMRFPGDGGWFGKVLDKWQLLRGGHRSLSLLLTRDGCDMVSHGPRIFSAMPHIIRSDADIVSSINWYWSPPYQTHLARKFKRFIHVGVPLFHTAEAWCNRAIYKSMLRNCDAVLVNTSCEAEFVRDRATTRVEVTGVGVDPHQFERPDGGEIRARYGLENFPVVGFVGRQARNKGATRLLKAMKSVWKWNREVRLVLAGPRTPQHNEVKAVIESAPPFERERVVRIEDFPEADKASIFDALDVLVLPSTAESFGITYLEAWLCKKPVIGGRIGPTQCVIDEGVDGLLVDPNDPEDIARAIIELLSNSGMRERMGRRGHAKTIAHYTWDKVTDKVETLYSELVANKRTNQ